MYNAFTEEIIKNGTVFSNDKFGMIYLSLFNYMEHRLDLLGEDINIFTKHSAINDLYIFYINPEFSVSFNSTRNELIITKPIFNEIFKFTVIVTKSSEVEKLTICDLSFSEDKKQFGDYVATFTSVTSNKVIYYIDFGSFGYHKGDKFWVLVYAEQLENSKMEFIYPVIQDEVKGDLKITEINEIIDMEYMAAHFEIESRGNYLYYDFLEPPIGNVTSIRINSDNIKVSEIGCIFVPKDSSDEYMINAVNQAMIQNISCCFGDKDPSAYGIDALVKANIISNNNRLVIKIVYQGEAIEGNAKIYIKKGGTELLNEGKYSEEELYTSIPYVIDLLKIRGNQMEDYVSQILFYSYSREMQMFYITENEPRPVTLFVGNIMLIYTNEELIKQKYEGATTMILITDALSHVKTIILGEQFRFITYFFNSSSNIQYLTSSNPQGRPLNQPISIEMASCSRPYYYIMNYNAREGTRILNIDTIFGEKKTIKFAANLYEESWEELINNMIILNNDQIYLESAKFHFDIIEVTCNLPLLINLFYTEPNEEKMNNLKIGDISIFSLEAKEQKILSFNLEQTGNFIYSFTIEKSNEKNPNISIIFDNREEIAITNNGIYTKHSSTLYNIISVKNNGNSRCVGTRIIFKFGLEIESIYQKDEKGIYSNDNDMLNNYNLYGYIYDQFESKYNYTGVDFQVSTSEYNVKFCYYTNFGAYIYPSLENCYRVGKFNPYIISTLNPYIMYRKHQNDNNMKYYVGFRTLNRAQKIVITPMPRKYNTFQRNFEGVINILVIPSNQENISTILTPPKNNDKYIIIETCLCAKNSNVSYQILNAYNGSILVNHSQLNGNNVKINIIENTKLDTELRILGGKEGYEIFVKHSGYMRHIYSSPRKIYVMYNSETQVLSWTQPLFFEKFKYYIYLDKIGAIREKNYTLCAIAKLDKLGHYQKILITDSNIPNITIDFSDSEFGPEFGDFDVIIIAEQLKEPNFIFISETYDYKNDSYEEEDHQLPKAY